MLGGRSGHSSANRAAMPAVARREEGTSAARGAGASGTATAGDARKRERDPTLPQSTVCKQQRTPISHIDGDELAHQTTQAYIDLTASQKTILKRMVSLLRSETDSVVITNPLFSNSPIVHVTQAWQAMCGYTTREACGQNPRMTQGVGTDKDTIKLISAALALQRPCKVRLLNFRGDSKEPFWNCLTIHPVFHQKRLVFFMARLQDYSFRLNRLMHITPAQFCKAGSDAHACRISLSRLQSAQGLARSTPPALCIGRITELDEEVESLGAVAGECGARSFNESSSGELDDDDSVEVVPVVPTPIVKRLSFPRLLLEPEYIKERLQDECTQLQCAPPNRGTAHSASTSQRNPAAPHAQVHASPPPHEVAIASTGPVLEGALSTRGVCQGLRAGRRVHPQSARAHSLPVAPVSGPLGRCAGLNGDAPTLPPADGSATPRKWSHLGQSSCGSSWFSPRRMEARACAPSCTCCPS